jgi:hypothetical protein
MYTNIQHLHANKLLFQMLKYVQIHQVFGVLYTWNAFTLLGNKITSEIPKSKVTDF